MHGNSKKVTKKKYVNKFWLLYLLPCSAYCGLYAGKEGDWLLDKVGYYHCGHRYFGCYLLFISIVIEHLWGWYVVDIQLLLKDLITNQRADKFKENYWARATGEAFGRPGGRYQSSNVSHHNT